MKARPWAKAIRDEVLARRMPPWDGILGVGDFRDNLSLSPPEVDLLGAPVYLPPVQSFPAIAAESESAGEKLGSVTLSNPMTLLGIRPEVPPGSGGRFARPVRPQADPGAELEPRPLRVAGR